MRYFIVTGYIYKRGIFRSTKNHFYSAITCKNYPAAYQIGNKMGSENVMIQNIIELNESDYNSFISKDIT